MYLVSTSVSVDNFPSRHAGLIVGLTGAFYWIGPSLFSLIYIEQFAEDPIGNFFLCLALSVATENILSALFIRHVPGKDSENENEPLLEHNTAFVTDTDAPESWYEKTGFNHFLLASFQLLAWGFISGCAVENIFFLNIGTFAESYKFKGLGEGLPVIGPFIGGIFTFFGGYFSDRTKKTTSRLAYVIVGTSVQTLFLFTLIWGGSNMYLFAFTVFVLYSNNGLFWSIIPTLVSDYFGLRHFTRNLGLNLMVNAMVTVTWSWLFGWFYEENITNTTSTVCMGQHCFMQIYILVTLSSLISVVLFVWLLILERRLLSRKRRNITFSQTWFRSLCFQEKTFTLRVT